MNKEYKIVPKLRFPEFVNEGEWSIESLKNLGQFLGGGTPDKSNNDYWSGNIPWISSSDVYEDDIHNISITRFIIKKAVKESATKIIPKGSVLFVSRVGVGKLVINKEEVCTSQDFTNFIPKKEVLDFFIGYYFASNKNLLQSLNQGTSIKGFTKSDFENFKLPYPDCTAEQQKIASCLSSLDELIAAHTDKLEALKDHKKGLMQLLFPAEGETIPKLRFKEFENDGEWVETTIEDHIDLFSGIALKSEELSDDNSGIPILRGINITEGCIRHSNEIDKFYLGDLSKLRKYLIKENDIVIGMDGSKVGKNVAIVKKEDVDSILIQRVARIRTNQKADKMYLYQHFLSNKFRDYVDKVNTSSGIPHISAQQIKDFKIGFPPKLREQQKIASLLSSLDDEITAQVQKIEGLKEHKKGLMQGLFPAINE